MINYRKANILKAGAVVGILSTTLFLGAGQAKASLVVNGDFSADSYPANSYVPIPGGGTLTGWTVLATGNIAGIGIGYLSAPTQEIDLSGTVDSAGSGITQSLATVAGNSYVLSFDYYTDGDVNPAYAGKLHAEIDGTDVTGELQSDPTSSARVLETVTFTAATNSTTLGMINDGGLVSHVSNVSVNPVPEPASLVGLGVAGIAALRRRRR